MAHEQATLGGGCFWCLEAVFEQLRGVERVESGYAGGSAPNPTYKAVCRGDTGHAEVVQVTFDPAVITFRELLDVFFAVHDPTTPNRQGNDVGTQYRSAVFYHSPEQQATTEAVIAELTAAAPYCSTSRFTSRARSAAVAPCALPLPTPLAARRPGGRPRRPRFFLAFDLYAENIWGVMPMLNCSLR